ncbi:MAG: penicillin acylase family protein [Deltaproteobacteria bacterium]|nr:penicillin acylase family protein [Deltaproteobacteria bacterium]
MRKRKFVAGCISWSLLALSGCPGRNNAIEDSAVDTVARDATVDDLNATQDAAGDVPQGRGVESLPIAQRVDIAGLSGPVDVVIDRHGWSHVRGRSLDDVAAVQGYVMARDRMPQMELLRRSASGTMAELFGSLSMQLIDDDLSARAVGLRRTATQIWEETPPGRVRRMFEAYARGVNTYLAQIRRGDRAAPAGTELVLNDGTTDWTPIDSMVVGRLLALSQGYLAPEELRGTDVRQRLAETFDDADPMTQRERALRAGMFLDFVRFRSESDTFVTPGFFARAGSGLSATSTAVMPSVPSAVLSRALRFASNVEHIRRWFGTFARGSNNFVVHGSATASGHALLESDPHMELPQPSILYGTHLTVLGGPDALDVAGVAIPGTPGVLIGFNEHVSWGMTNSFYDGVDVYAEQISPAAVAGQPDTVRFQGRDVALGTITERVANGSGGFVEARFEVVPHHGVIVPEIRGGRVIPRTSRDALTVRWVGHAPTHEAAALVGLAYARNVGEARAALRQWGAPPISFVFADDTGAVGFSSQVQLPVRALGARSFDPASNPRGTLPCTILPGDGTAEWEGMADAALLPSAEGSATTPFIVTANNDTAGNTADNNPVNDRLYLGCRWAYGWRAERITTRLTEQGRNATRESIEAITGDHVMLAGRRFRPFIVSAFEALEREWLEPGREPTLSTLAAQLRPRAARLRDAVARLRAWSFDAASGVGQDAAEVVPESARRDAVATTIFHGWLVALLDKTFGDELEASGISLGGFVTNQVRLGSALFLLERPTEARTLDAATGESWIWDDLRTPGRERRDEVLVSALDRALTELERVTSSADMSTWLWGNLHTLRFTSMVPGPGAANSIPAPTDMMFPRGFPRPGGIEVVDASDPSLSGYRFAYGGGPAQRFTVEMDPTGPIAFNVIAGGTSIDRRSRFHRNEADLWRRNQSHRVPMHEDDIVAIADSRHRYEPAP